MISSRARGVLRLNALCLRHVSLPLASRPELGASSLLNYGTSRSLASRVDRGARPPKEYDIVDILQDGIPSTVSPELDEDVLSLVREDSAARQELGLDVASEVQNEKLDSKEDADYFDPNEVDEEELNLERELRKAEEELGFEDEVPTSKRADDSSEQNSAALELQLDAYEREIRSEIERLPASFRRLARRELNYDDASQASSDDPLAAIRDATTEGEGPEAKDSEDEADSEDIPPKLRAMKAHLQSTGERDPILAEMMKMSPLYGPSSGGAAGKQKPPVQAGDSIPVTRGLSKAAQRRRRAAEARAASMAAEAQSFPGAPPLSLRGRGAPAAGVDSEDLFSATAEEAPGGGVRPVRSLRGIPAHAAAPAPSASAAGSSPFMFACAALGIDPYNVTPASLGVAALPGESPAEAAEAWEDALAAVDLEEEGGGLPAHCPRTGALLTDRQRRGYALARAALAYFPISSGSPAGSAGSGSSHPKDQRRRSPGGGSDGPRVQPAPVAVPWERLTGRGLSVEGVLRAAKLGPEDLDSERGGTDDDHIRTRIRDTLIAIAATPHSPTHKK